VAVKIVVIAAKLAPFVALTGWYIWIYFHTSGSQATDRDIVGVAILVCFVLWGLSEVSSKATDALIKLEELNKRLSATEEYIKTLQRVALIQIREPRDRAFFDAMRDDSKGGES
jgi:hypothetical protein